MEDFMSNLEFFGYVMLFWFAIGLLVGIAVGHAIYAGGRDNEEG